MAYFFKAVVISLALSSSLFATSKIIVGSFVNYSGAKERLHQTIKYLENNEIVMNIESNNKFHLSIVQSSPYHVVIIEPFFHSFSLNRVFKEVQKNSRDAYVVKTEGEELGGYKKYFLTKKTRSEELDIKQTKEVKQVATRKEKVPIKEDNEPVPKQKEVLQKPTEEMQGGKLAFYASIVLGVLVAILFFLLVSSRKFLFGTSK